MIASSLVSDNAYNVTCSVITVGEITVANNPVSIATDMVVGVEDIVVIVVVYTSVAKAGVSAIITISVVSGYKGFFSNRMDVTADVFVDRMRDILVV